MSSANNPIAVFDSGIGGLTVLKALATALPNENFVYLGDTARLPYGTKSPDVIRNYTEQNLKYLFKSKAKAFVIACNTASSQWPEKDYQGHPTFNVINPGALAAIQASATKKIAILGTRATVASKAYDRALKALDSEIETFSQACPLFVPLAEEGWIDDPITNLITYRYCQPLLEKGVDTVILGCTHYPLLKSSIQKVFGKSVTLVDSSLVIKDQLSKFLKDAQLERSETSELRSIDIFCTDLSKQFQSLGQSILDPLEPNSWQAAHLF